MHLRPSGIRWLASRPNAAHADAEAEADPEILTSSSLILSACLASPGLYTVLLLHLLVLGGPFMHLDVSPGVRGIVLYVIDRSSSSSSIQAASCSCYGEAGSHVVYCVQYSTVLY